MRILFLMFVSVFFSVSVYAANMIGPVGYWKTIDDVTGKPKSIIKIWEDQNHLLQGTVVKIFSEAKAGQRKLCEKCDGDKHNQPIVGMTILTNLKLDEDQWSGGKILDPSSGKTYKCNLHTLADGRKLKVRGYIGLPMLGRSQTWERMSEHEFA